MGTQPLQKTSRPITSKPKTRPSQTRPFDPDELSRKLYAVLAEQKSYAEKKRRAKVKADADRRVSAARKVAESRAGSSDKSSPPRRRNDDSSSTQTLASRPKSKEVHGSRRSHEGKPSTALNADVVDSTEPHGYRHIPQVAASQFARTTRAEDVMEKQLVHRLSRPAMKFHMEGPNASREMADVHPDTAPIESAKALRRAQSMREKLYERNQFQNATMLQAPMEVDEQLGSVPQCRSFDAQRRPKWIDSEEMAYPRISTGALFGWEPNNKRFSGGFEGVVLVERPESSDHYELANANEHRVDWTQSDETVPRQATAPVPRKHESKWNLRGRIVSFNRHGKDDKPGVLASEKVAYDESSKPSKGGFFARFKR